MPKSIQSFKFSKIIINSEKSTVLLETSCRDIKSQPIIINFELDEDEECEGQLTIDGVSYSYELQAPDGFYRLSLFDRVNIGKGFALSQDTVKVFLFDDITFV